jgi:hypothetical protein
MLNVVMLNINRLSVVLPSNKQECLLLSVTQIPVCLKRHLSANIELG